MILILISCNYALVMAKTLCDWSKKDLEKKQDTLQQLTRNACFYCRKCARVANNAKSLCKANAFETSMKKEQDNILPFSKSA